MDNILSGAIAGLIASLFVLVVIKLFMSFVIPRVRKALHIGLDLTGVWVSADEISDVNLSIKEINIKQFGHDLYGSFKLDNENGCTKSFKFYGKCLERLVMARFSKLRTSSATSGTILLDSDLYEQVLKGFICIVERDNTIIKYPLRLVKKGE